MNATTSEIHRYPVRPEGFAEPLFLGYSAKKEIAEHLAASGWLSKASDAARGVSQERPCHLYRGTDGRVWLVRWAPRGSRTRTGIPTEGRKRRIARVIERWREVSGWWEQGGRPGEAGGTDRLCYRVLASGAGGGAGTGAVLDLAYECTSGEWLLTSVVD